MGNAISSLVDNYYLTKNNGYDELSSIINEILVQLHIFEDHVFPDIESGRWGPFRWHKIDEVQFWAIKQGVYKMNAFIDKYSQVKIDSMIEKYEDFGIILDLVKTMKGLLENYVNKLKKKYIKRT